MANESSDKQSSQNEPFELLELLGMGGFAQTYRARVLHPDVLEDFGSEIIALKIPLPQKERALKQDLEMNILLHLRIKDLQSVNLVRYLGFDWYDGKIVLAFEYIASGSLRDKIGNIGSQKRLPIDEAVKIAGGILKGLSAIHSEQVFHRDIKPENILMQGNVAKIADLGLSRFLNPNELASTTSGSPFYMSPEILSRTGASFSSDIWSLGVTMYEIVTGQLPFGDKDTALGDLIDLIRNEKPAPACEVCQDVPKGLSDVIARALSKEPSDRYSSADEMIEVLGRFREEKDGRIEKEMASIRQMMSDFEDTKLIESKLLDILNRYSKDSRAYQYLGEFYNRCYRYGEGIAVFKKGLKLDADNALLRWDLALAYQKMGKKSDAIQSLKKAMSLELDPSLRRHADILLKSLRENGK